MPKKIRIGLFMYAPIIGGAEQHFKDLLWRIDRSRFQIVLFCESWAPFDAFLDLEHCPEVEVRRVSVTEMIGHHAEPPSGRDKNDHSRMGSAERLIQSLKRIRDRFPFPGRVWLNRTLGLVFRYGLLPLNYYRLSRVFRETPVDVLHVVNGGYPAAQTAVLAAIAAQNAGCKKVIMSVTNMPFPRAFPRFLEAWIDRRVQYSVSRFLIPSDNVGVALTELRGMPAAMIQKIYYGAEDVAVLARNARPEGKWKTQLAAMGPGPVVGMVANFLPHKGYRHLIAAASEIVRTYPNVKFLLIGNGPELEAMVQLVAERGLSGRVVFTGRCSLPDTLRLMEELSVFVLSSELEGMPYVVIHAMNLGLPMVVSRVGAVSEMFVDGESGYIVPPADVPALRDKILTMLGNSTAARAMGAQSRERYEAYFSLRAMMKNHETLYQSV